MPAIQRFATMGMSLPFVHNISLGRKTQQIRSEDCTSEESDRHEAATTHGLGERAGVCNDQFKGSH